jgi:DNA-binding HxlR family transcriptional regulator
MLTLTLRKLERDGLVTRTAFAEVPPRVEYDLSPLGRTLVDPVTALADWALHHHAQLDDSRRAFAHAAIPSAT